MELSRFEEKRCRITTDFGNVFEGVCRYYDSGYMMHEYGIDEDALIMGAFLLPASQIEKAEELEEEGPWGGYSGPWGQLEETAAADGPLCVAEVLTWEEDETAIRMMRLLKEDVSGLAFDPEVIDALKELAALTESREAREMAESLLEIAAGRDKRV